MINRRIVGAVLPSHAERHAVLDRVGEGRELFGKFRCVAEVSADRCIAAGDVESDADDGDFVAIGRDATDRHDVADMTVRHQRRAFSAAGDVLELCDGLGVVLAEDRDSLVRFGGRIHASSMDPEPLRRNQPGRSR